MSPRQRIEAVLAEQQPDRPPFSFWYHFAGDEAFGPAALEAHLDQLQTYQLDFLKVMNDNPYPHHQLITSIEDLKHLKELRGDEPEFTRQLELISTLRHATRGQVPMTTTIFNPWAVLRMLIQPPHAHLPPNLNATSDTPSDWIRTAWRQSPNAVATALHTIGRSLSNFASRCLDAGADGIFLSVREDWVDAAPGHGLYKRLMTPIDLHILKAASRGWFNMLHVCGKAIDFRQFGEYPVHVINWADRAAGPSIAAVKDWLRPAICAGVDNLRTLPEGSPQEVAGEVADAIKQAGNRPIMISAGCTFDPARVPKANLLAMSEAVRGAS
jgi:uroporphyrinogen decarboxylase